MENLKALFPLSFLRILPENINYVSRYTCMCTQICIFPPPPFFFGHAVQHVGSQLPNQGSNPRPLQWKCRVLTTGPTSPYIPSYLHRICYACLVCIFFMSNKPQLSFSVNIQRFTACQCRGHGFDPWSGKIPHAAEQLSPCATTTEPAATEPTYLQLVLRNKRSHHNEKPAHHNEEQPPLAATRESLRAVTKTHLSQK